MQERISLHPRVSANEYRQSRPDMDRAPDGVGVQIVFHIQGKNYLIAGPRIDKLITVNGGAIENPNAPLFKQLQEEVEEESFGQMRLKETNGIYSLCLYDGSVHSLHFQDNAFLFANNFVYVTFTAVCYSVTLEQLNWLVERMTPTAKFWYQIGTYLFPHTNKAAPNIPQDDVGFAAYWRNLSPQHQKLIQKLTMEHNDSILISPQFVLGGNSVAESLNRLNTVASVTEVRDLMRKVGSYSERPAYHVFDVNKLVASAKRGLPLLDVKGNTVAAKLFNMDAAKYGLSQAVTRTPAGHSRWTLFAAIAATSVVSAALASNSKSNKL